MSTPPPKKGSGEHPMMLEAIRRIDEADREILPALKAATERFSSAVDAAVEADPPPPKNATAGAWSITLSGAGPHHNGDLRDIEILFASFLGSLSKAGHRTTVPRITFGDTQGAAKKDDKP